MLDPFGHEWEIGVPIGDWPPHNAPASTRPCSQYGQQRREPYLLTDSWLPLESSPGCPVVHRRVRGTAACSGHCRISFQRGTWLARLNRSRSARRTDSGKDRARTVRRPAAPDRAPAAVARRSRGRAGRPRQGESDARKNREPSSRGTHRPVTRLIGGRRRVSCVVGVGCISARSRGGLARGGGSRGRRSGTRRRRMIARPRDTRVRQWTTGRAVSVTHGPREPAYP